MTVFAKRCGEIDGIRGWAAISVMLFHVIIEFYGTKIPEFRNPIFKTLFNGPLAVSIFFILSGWALSINCMNENGDVVIKKILLRRYFRLTIPILIAGVFVYSASLLGLIFNKEASEVLNNSWLAGFLNFKISFADFLQYTFIDVYRNSGVTKEYNPFLWTMRYELVGSYFVILYSLIVRNLKLPIATTVAMIVAVSQIDLMVSLFFWGILFSVLDATGIRARAKNIQLINVVAIGMLLIVIGILYYYYWTKSSSESLSKIELKDIVKSRTSLMKELAVYCVSLTIVFSIYISTTLSRIFSGKLSIYLGKISFQLYLIHFFVLITLSSWIVVMGGGDIHTWSAYNLIATILVCFFAAHSLTSIEFNMLKWIYVQMDKITK